MPTLLQISLSVTDRSVGGIAKQIGQSAIADGWNSYITYTTQTELATSESQLIRISSRCDFYLHALLTRCLDLHGLGSYFSTRKLVRQIKRIKPDIIQIHNLHGYYINYVTLFKYLNKTDIPIVWTFHDCWSFTGHCAHFVTQNCNKWQTGCGSCPLQNEYPKSFIDNSSLNYKLKKKFFSENRNLHIVTVSQWLANFVKESFFKECNISVIHNGINTNIYKPLNVHHTTFTIIGVSSVWNREKGLYDFYELRKRLPKDISIYLVGLKSEQIQELPSGIIGRERTSNTQQLAALYNEADVFVNPTYADSFPTVNLEALACGKPVITYRTGGSPEAIDENTGIVVEQGDIEGLVKAIMTIKCNHSKYSSVNCRNRAEKHFDKTDCFKQYIELYRKLL